MTTLPPLHREVLVEADPAFAFEVFTDQIGQWWPLGQLSVHGAEATVAFEDGRIVERSPSGAHSVWGTVTDWHPGGRLSFTWHPGKEATQASEVTVTFHERGPRTLVVLEHRGWEVFADPQAARAEYDHGWPTVLGCFSQRATDTAPCTWVALMHTPGPTAPVDTTVFQDPRFREHVDFLQRMHAEGYLVAAGPLDAAGAGMTVLRLPGADRHEDAVQLATQDDRSVLGGLFQVDVRPWNVMLHAVPRPSLPV